MDKRDLDKLLDKLIAHTDTTGALASAYKDKKSFVYVGLGTEGDEMWMLWNMMRRFKRDIKALRTEADEMERNGKHMLATVKRGEANDLEASRQHLINGPPDSPISPKITS